MKLNDMKRNEMEMLACRVIMAMDEGHNNPTDIAVVLGEPIELVTEARQLIVDYLNKKSGK